MEHGLKDIAFYVLKTYSSSSSLVITSRWFATSRLVVPASVRLVYWISPRGNYQGRLEKPSFPDTVVDMAAKPLRNSSGNVYNSHWKTFTLWANNKGFLPGDISYVTLAEYLVYLFSQHKKMNTIQIHKASISSVLKLLNPPTALPEETLHNVIRRMTILRPREQDVLPKCGI